MRNRAILGQFMRFFVALSFLGLANVAHATVSDAYSNEVKSCLKQGWKHLSVRVGGLERAVLWKRPRGKWKQGAMLIMHAGGGSHHQFCTGGDKFEAQIDFAKEAVEEGFAVFLLDSTKNKVTDSRGQSCGKRFDFSVLPRRNIDLPFVGKMIKTVIPQLRPGRSSKKIFLTGLSSGGYMATRAATYFNDKVSAFAPVAAGDPYGTRTRCGVKGVFIDIETNKRVTAKAACQSRYYPNEIRWPKARTKFKSSFKQFHHKGDAIVDFSCMKKSQKLLQQHGYRNSGAYVIDSSKRRVDNHLWQEDYNDAIIDFFKSQ